MPLAALPIDLFAREIQEIAAGGAVLAIVKAETGAGKSTRVPRFLLQRALKENRPCCIAVGVP